MPDKRLSTPVSVQLRLDGPMAQSFRIAAAVSGMTNTQFAHELLDDMLVEHIHRRKGLREVILQALLLWDMDEEMKDGIRAALRTDDGGDDDAG